MPLADRVHRVRLLLVTLNDGYPTVRGGIATPSGPVEGRRVPCTDCLRRGWIKTRSGMTRCLICDGSGWKLRTIEEPWDEYVGLPTQEAAELPVMPSAPPATAILARLADEQAEREGRYAHLAYGWERARQAADRKGSYPELRRSLERMREHRPRMHRLVTVQLVNGEQRELSPGARTQVELGVVWTALDMRGPIRVPHWVMDQHRAETTLDTVATLARDGLSAGQIAARTGMTRKPDASPPERA
jgi:hypothetical protein